VCFWEDGGSVKVYAVNGPNGMTLGDAKVNFLKFGACSEGSLRFLDEEWFLQFEL
jgi:hypothetical protein